MACPPPGWIREIKRGSSFLEGASLKDAVVAGLIESGAPFAAALSHGFVPSGRVLRVKDVKGEKTISAFHDDTRTPAEILKGLRADTGSEVVLFNDLTGAGRLRFLVPREPVGGTVVMQRDVGKYASLEVWKPGPNMNTAARDAVVEACDKHHVDNPGTDLVFLCTARYRKRYEIKLDVEQALTVMSQALKGSACLGGLFDGEMGQVDIGSSVFANWAISQLVIGDQIRDRTLIERGFGVLGDHGPYLLISDSLQKLAEHCVRLVSDIGYPGAMLSLVFCDESGQWIVAIAAAGSRFRRIKEMTQRPLGSGDILADRALARRRVHSRFKVGPEV